MILFSASFVSSANTPFKPLFPAPNNLTQIPSSGSPLLFQQKSNNMPTLNPLLQPPTSVSQFSSPLIQPSIRPPSMPSAFQAPPSAFTPLNPANNQQISSLIQPKLTIGTQPLPTVPLVQPIQFPFQNTQGIETIPGPPLGKDFPITQHDSQLVPPPSLPPSTMIKDPNTALPPPPSSQQPSAGTKIIVL